MANDFNWNNRDLCYYGKGQYTCHADLKRYRHLLSNLLFNIYYAHFFKSVNDSWQILKLYALHIHRARAPTVKGMVHLYNQPGI
jgi:hypothetical protein